MEHYDRGPNFHDGKRVIFVSGDDKEAKAVVTGPIAALGYAPGDLGDRVSGGRMQQACGPVAGRDWVVAPLAGDSLWLHMAPVSSPAAHVQLMILMIQGSRKIYDERITGVRASGAWRA